VLPGAEQISEAEQAKRGAQKPLKPKVAQKPADEGLFGEQGQTDLVDMARKPPPEPVKEEPRAKAPEVSRVEPETPAAGPSDSGPLFALEPPQHRQRGIPAAAREPIFDVVNDRPLKAHADYANQMAVGQFLSDRNGTQH
jgi:hypothetical protein